MDLHPTLDLALTVAALLRRAGQRSAQQAGHLSNSADQK